MAETSSVVADISFGDGDSLVHDSRIQTYKNKVKNKTDRIAIVARCRTADGKFNMDKPLLKVADSHYIDGLGYVLCTKGYCCERQGAAKCRIATVIVQYSTDNDGTINKEKFSYEVMPWIMNPDQYSRLKKLNLSSPLSKKDLIVTCQKPDFSEYQIDPVAEGTAAWLQVPGMMEAVMKKVAVIEKTLDNLLGKTMTADELKENLGGAAVATTGEQSADFTSVLNNL
jgi:hypothetical protein